MSFFYCKVRRLKFSIKGERTITDAQFSFETNGTGDGDAVNHIYLRAEVDVRRAYQTRSFSRRISAAAESRRSKSSSVSLSDDGTAPASRRDGTVSQSAAFNSAIDRVEAERENHVFKAGNGGSEQTRMRIAEIKCTSSRSTHGTEAMCVT